MSDNNSIISLAWPYIVELSAASLLYILCNMYFEAPVISEFVIKTSEHILSKFAYLMLTASIGFYWVFWQQSDSSFSKWLQSKGAYEVYSRSFLLTILIFFLTIVAISLCEITKNNIIGLITGWILIVAAINVFTFFKNIYDLLNLKMAYQEKVSN